MSAGERGRRLTETAPADVRALLEACEALLADARAWGWPDRDNSTVLLWSKHVDRLAAAVAAVRGEEGDEG